MTTTASIPPTVRWLIATVLTAFGGIALAVGLGVISLPPEKLRAPLWIVSACGVSFGALGHAVALEGAERFKGLRGGLGLVFHGQPDDCDSAGAGHRAATAPIRQLGALSDRGAGAASIRWHPRSTTCNRA